MGFGGDLMAMNTRRPKVAFALALSAAAGCGGPARNHAPAGAAPAAASAPAMASATGAADPTSDEALRPRLARLWAAPYSNVPDWPAGIDADNPGPNDTDSLSDVLMNPRRFGPSSLHADDPQAMVRFVARAQRVSPEAARVLLLAYLETAEAFRDKAEGVDLDIEAARRRAHALAEQSLRAAPESGTKASGPLAASVVAAASPARRVASLSVAAPLLPPESHAATSTTASSARQQRCPMRGLFAVTGWVDVAGSPVIEPSVCGGSLSRPSFVEEAKLHQCPSSVNWRAPAHRPAPAGSLPQSVDTSTPLGRMTMRVAGAHL